ncbi:MAG TPA: hypothetical protein ENO20_02030 [Bacteroides sp.]|nr:hypothetical protein [Bacteroides sp.]
MVTRIKQFNQVLQMAAGMIILSIAAASCTKTEGEGGTGSISGTLMEHFYNDDYSQLIHTAPAVDEDIFIHYGEDLALGDRIRTGATGGFRFDFLYPGSYSVFYLTQDSTAGIMNEEVAKLVEVELDRGGEVDLGELVRLTTLDFDDGQAVIKGVVKLIDYVDDSRWPNLVVDFIAYAYEQEVYLTYGNHTFYDERIRTQHDGSFEFRNLIPGDYLVVLYSEDVTRVTDKVALKFETTITEMDQVVDLGEITIEER